MHNFSSALTSPTCPPVAGRLPEYLFRLYVAYAFFARTWPAVWENGDPWPSKVRIILFCDICHFLMYVWLLGVGNRLLCKCVLADLSVSFYSSLRTNLISEIDIVEGVNSHGTNQVSIHTSGGMCLVSSFIVCVD